MSEKNSIHATSVLTNCTLGENVVIGPFCFLSDVIIGNNVRIEGNVRIEKSTLHDTVEVLWGSVIRESVLENGCVIGCEVKKSHLGPYTKAKHPGTSIISTQTGTKVNFGGGAKCANYDGK
jgi:bifunctional UDP-N-acetylglucosamine pyrophosphorylase / glucosamine-1-phosphate N-acetyltransferase